MTVGVVVGLLGMTVTPLGRDLAFHAMPFGWTGEPLRLATALDLRPGDTVAEIGAGGGALIVELANRIGPGGKAFATERTADQRDAIARRARAAGVALSVLEAPDLATNLPDGCCDGIVMRMVLHHISDLRVYARGVRHAVKSDGRVAVIDFASGALPHLTDDHGVAADVAIAAFQEAGFTLVSRADAWGGGTYLLVLAPAMSELGDSTPRGSGLTGTPAGEVARSAHSRRGAERTFRARNSTCQRRSGAIVPGGLPWSRTSLP